jgi:hypothetical protein
MQMNHWQVDLCVEPIDKPKTCATFTADPKYQQIALTFDPAKIDTEEDALKVLRHEMIHGLLAEFNLLYDAMERVAPRDEMTLLDTIYHHSLERSVVSIERMLDSGLGLSGMAFIQRAKKVSKNYDPVADNDQDEKDESTNEQNK